MCRNDTNDTALATVSKNQDGNLFAMFILPGTVWHCLGPSRGHHGPPRPLSQSEMSY